MHYLRVDEIQERLADIHKLTHMSYPEFISHGYVSGQYWDELYTSFPEYQKILMDGSNLVAVGNSIPVCIQDQSGFSENGWDWALQTGVEQLKEKKKANVLIGHSVGISEGYRGQNLSLEILREFKRIALDSKFARVIIPIRPTRKHEFPDLSFEEYIEKRPDGNAFDPWIRTHEKIGGRRICVARSSMLIESTLENWERWTGTHFLTSGNYHVPGGLAPLFVNVETNQGMYVEPNLWMEHDTN